MEQQQQHQLQRIIHPRHQHPLLFNPDDRSRWSCVGCRGSVCGPSYSCKECWPGKTIHHKSCAEVPLGLHHPLHSIHPLILFSPGRFFYPGRYEDDERQFYKCQLCKEYRDVYTYRCSRCDFNLHITCASLLPTLEVEFHDHPLTPIWKSFTFTCDICGKEDNKGMPYLCNTCGIWIHRRCAYQYPRMVKVVRHKHLLHVTHSSLQFHQSDSQFCQLCVRKVDTRYGLYYCSKCNFVAHLDCAIAEENREDIDLSKFEDENSEVDESIDSAAPYEVKKFIVGEDKTQIDTEIAHFSHKHDLNLTDEVQNNHICDGCVRPIPSPFYSCIECSFFLHDSCANLPKKKKHPLHQHPLTLLKKPKWGFSCDACGQYFNGFAYTCEKCYFHLDVQCSLISDILPHEGHGHQLLLSIISQTQKCNCCDNLSYQVFRCTTCEFALDFKCASLPLFTRYEQHEHPFTLCYAAEDDSGEYYCDICEEERDSKHWFYYCKDCSYSAHPKCILGEYPNCK